MKIVLLYVASLFLFSDLFPQTTYTFTGNGYWTDAANWTNNTIPPPTLPSGSTININPKSGDSCILNTNQILVSGANLIVSTGANFIIQGDIISPGNFESVVIGSQIWLKQNLQVETYKNGDTIPQVTDPDQWTYLTTGAWCYYNNDSSGSSVYGKLYNWYAVHDPRGLGPIGWHVPSDSEWTTLATFLGGDSVAGGKMKSTTLWVGSNVGATNESGFTGYPAGLREWNGRFYEKGLYGIWWSSTEFGHNSSWCRVLYTDDSRFARSNPFKVLGYSVRCIKD